MKRSQILRIVLGGVAIKQSPQIVWGGRGVPYTNQHRTLIMFYHNKTRNVNQPLVKIKSGSDKLEKAMNEPVREYNAIKELVENQNNNIMNIKIKNTDLKPLPPKQKIYGIRSKKY